MDDKWHFEKLKFFDLLNWIKQEEKGIVNYFNIEYITIDNRYITASEDIEVINKH